MDFILLSWMEMMKNKVFVFSFIVDTLFHYGLMNVPIMLTPLGLFLTVMAMSAISRLNIDFMNWDMKLKRLLLPQRQPMTL